MEVDKITKRTTRLEKKLCEEQLRKTYRRWLPDLLARIEHALATAEQEMSAARRDTSDLIEETLQEVMKQSRVLTEILARLPTETSTLAHTETRTPVHTEPSDAESVFDQCKLDDDDESWQMGEINVKIIHRGRIKINRTEWHQVIDTCSDGFIEDGIRKDFHLNILLHPSSLRLIYISYRYKHSGDKQRERRQGILLDEQSNIPELMMHLAYWFTAQPYAEKNYSVWKKLVDEAMKKLRRPSEF